jgi:hypothetical protein
MKTNLWPFIAIGGIGVWLLSKPNCRDGCKTVAEHLLTYGIEGLFA